MFPNLHDDSVKARFWAKVAISEPDQCWEWRVRRNPQGYGSFNLNGKTQRAHRLAYALAYGPIPDGQLVCHHCDNPPCCNPAHLFAGTHADNMRDKTLKGRNIRPVRDESAVNYVRGESNNLSKLNEDIVRAIRQRKASGDRTNDLAAEFRVDRTLIWQIVARKVWAHVE
jgi:hypothetical protein